MMKSVTVAVTRLFRHTRVGKTVRETKKYMVRHGRNCGVAKHGTLSTGGAGTRRAERVWAWGPCAP